MRIPKIFNSKLDSDEVIKHTIKLDLEPIPYYPPSFKDDDKDYIKLIKSIEKLVRGSYEYKSFINYLKNEINMNSCSFFNKLTREDISIEIHHSPFTLFEIAVIVLNKHIAEFGEDNFDIYDVAEEVTRLHYEGKVGLIPLSLTVHELVHRGDIFIPINCVFGNVSEFYKEYKPYISAEQKELLKNHIRTTKQIDKEHYNPNVLERQYTYIEMDGITLPKIVSSKEKIKEVI